MKFSIVTISFNQAEFVERTIRSVLGQSGVEVEYIVVDPGSTDGSRDIIESYRDRLSKVILERDKGPADGLNRGFAHATGEIYCYLNSDDTFAPDAFSRVAAFFERHPQYDVICGHAYVTDGQDRILRRVWSEPITRRRAAYGMAIQIQPSTFIRREAFLKIGGFNVENRSNWDGELICDLFLSGAKIGIIDEFLSSYRLHSVSITNSGRLAKLIEKNGEDRFRQLMGRAPNALDPYIAHFFRLAKHVTSPRAAWERLTKGSIYNRGVD